MSASVPMVDSVQAARTEVAGAAKTGAVIEAVEANGEVLLRYFTRRVDHREDAADLLGETLLVVWRRAAQLPSGEDEARMWMFGIARRVLLTHNRGQGRKLALADKLRGELAVASSAAGVDGRPVLGGGDLREFVRSLIRDLDPLDQEIVALAHWERMPLADIAALIGMKQSTVRTRYARARESLRVALTEAGDLAR
jgi:RNA polymerase sigma-70 factor, ECF subfamily